MNTLYTVNLWCSKIDKIQGIVYLEHIPRIGELLIYKNVKYKIYEVLYKLKDNDNGVDWIVLNIDHN